MSTYINENPLVGTLQNNLVVALTAHAGGGQALGTPLVLGVNVFSTVATTGDSATLLDTNADGSMEVVVVNNGANAMNVFPFLGDQINSLGANNPYSLAVGLQVTFKSISTSKWLTTVSSSVPVPADLFEVGVGADSLKTVNATGAAGDQSIAIGLLASATSADSIAIGDIAISSASDAIAIGGSSEASAIGAIAIGGGASGSGAIAIGAASGSATGASGNNSIAIGAGANSEIADSIAIGHGSDARITKTIQLNGTLITKKDSSEADFQLNFSSSVVTITTSEVNLKATSDVVITIPAGSRFYPDSVDIIITRLTGAAITVQPTIRAGISGTPAKFIGPTLTTGLTTLFDRQIFDGLLTTAGEATLSAGVTVPATGGTTYFGRFIFSGKLIENA